jgi:hypothetical protein
MLSADAKAINTQEDNLERRPRAEGGKVLAISVEEKIKM